MSLTKDSPITEIKGIGEKQAKKFSKLDVTTIRDLLFHVPFRYQDTSSILSIAEFKENEEGTFLAKIAKVSTAYFKKKITTVKVKDDTGTLNLTYFNQTYLNKTLKLGDIYLFSAKITKKGSRKNVYNPKFEKFKEDPEKQTHLGKLVGIYPETKGLSSRMIRARIKTLIEQITEKEKSIGEIIEDPLKKKDLEKFNLISLDKAIANIHFPQTQEDIEKAQKRLAFDEMLRIAFKIEKQILKREKEKSIGMEIKSNYLNSFIKSLPFELTEDQNKAIEEILEDTTKTTPMNRLLNGDVGSGKTVVAAIAILNTIKNGNSAILIAPTTVLAKQHFETFNNLFSKKKQNKKYKNTKDKNKNTNKDFDIDVELCISTKKTIKKADNKLIIGTHAILYEKQLPKDLNLVVIDEQHRFGVEQREYFKQKSKSSPHYLTMTATPIPRSLTEIFFGGLEVSEIREKPKNRKKIETFFTPFKKREDCFNWVRGKILESEDTTKRKKKEGKGKYNDQAFIIYPLIEESEKLNAKAVLVEFDYLKEIFKSLRVEFLHGRLKEKEKERLMEKFREKKIQVLVSTTVIEVGIDIPDATIMVIEDAERFGLAQLHQLRGRVGRSDKESYCFVIPSSSVEKDSPAQERLLYFAKHNSGFDVAEYDLENRGPGEVYGLRQSGVPNFKVASIHDIELLNKSRILAKEIVREDNNPEEILENIFR
jgi:ATP-dependent DNA helicase RecG